jgi:hypothetical protein
MWALLLASVDPAALAAEAVSNYNKSEPARARYVYRQEVLGKLIRGNGKLARQERRVYDVVPGKDRSEKTMRSLQGACEHKGQRREYTDPDFECKNGLDIDSGLLDDMISDLVAEKDTVTGISDGVFPLKAEMLPRLAFEHLGMGELAGRTYHRIRYSPAKKDWDSPWAGEMWVDDADRHPVRVYSKLARRIPMAVKILLGTNVSQVGFDVRFVRQEEGVWFPVGFGTEFHIRAAFFYSRDITLSLTSSDFRRVAVESGVSFGGVVEPEASGGRK